MTERDALRDSKIEQGSDNVSSDTERTQWLPQPGQVLIAEIERSGSIDFLTLWPHLYAFAALDGTEHRSGAGAASNNRVLTRTEALVEIEQWRRLGATLKFSPGNGDDYGVWASEPDRPVVGARGDQ